MGRPYIDRFFSYCYFRALNRDSVNAKPYTAFSHRHTDTPTHRPIDEFVGVTSIADYGNTVPPRR